MSALAKDVETELQTISEPNSATEMLLNPQIMAQMQGLANMMASGKSTVPKHLQQSPGDCFAIIMQAAQWRMNPFAVAQKTHIVNGVLGYEAQLVNAVISSSNAISGRFHYEYKGDWSSDKDPESFVRVGALIKGEDEFTWGEWLSPATVAPKNSTLWKSAPKQQAAYLVLKYWARIYCPSVILGVYTPEEVEYKKQNEKEINPKSTTSSRAESIKAKARAKAAQKPALEAVDEVVPEVAPEVAPDGVPDGEITLIFVCDEIAKAKNKNDLFFIADLANSLNDHDKAIARDEYKARLNELKDK
jgi:hypothetical protein